MDIKDLYSSTGTRQQPLTNRLSLILGFAISILAAMFWCYFNFLTAEDSLVLFNRYNFLSDAPIYFYYAGYWSSFPQTIAYLVSNLNPAVQAIAYSIVSLGIFLILLREIFRATNSGVAVLTIVTVTSIFAPFMIFNLTYTFWPGLAVLGLIGLRANYQADELSFTDFLLCFPGLLGSPLGLLFFPLFTLAALQRRSWRSAVIASSTVLSYVILVERDGHRSSETGIVESTIDNLSQIFSGQFNLLFNTSDLGGLVMSGIGVLSVCITLIVGLICLVHFTKDLSAVLLYVVGSLATVAAALGAADLPLSGRYWFPIIICASILTGTIVMQQRFSVLRHFVEPVLILVFCGIFLSSSALRIQTWGGLSSAAKEWSLMFWSPDQLSALKRSWHADDMWAIGLGTGQLFYQDCAGLWEHPTSKGDYGFRVYCGESVF